MLCDENVNITGTLYAKKFGDTDDLESLFKEDRDDNATDFYTRVLVGGRGCTE